MPYEAETPEDAAFAERLFDPTFQKQVWVACKPIFPEALNPEKEDLIQEALTHAYANRAQFQGTTQEHLLGWVLRILRNMTRDMLRARKRRPGREDVEVEAIQDKKSADPAILAERAEAGEEEVELPPATKVWANRTNSLLSLLRKPDREVVRLCIGLGLTPKEAAEMLSAEGKRVTEGAVRTRLCRAQQRINEIAATMGFPKPKPPEDPPGEASPDEDA